MTPPAVRKGEMSFFGIDFQLYVSCGDWRFSGEQLAQGFDGELSLTTDEVIEPQHCLLLIGIFVSASRKIGPG